MVFDILLFFSGASRATGSPRRERTDGRRSPWSKGELMSFMSQAVRAHSVFSWETHALVKSFDPFSCIHLQFTHLPTGLHKGLRLATRFHSVMTGNWRRVWLQEMITQHRSSISSHTAVRYVSHYLMVWSAPLIVPAENMPVQRWYRTGHLVTWRSEWLIEERKEWVCSRVCLRSRCTDTHTHRCTHAQNPMIRHVPRHSWFHFLFFWEFPSLFSAFMFPHRGQPWPEAYYVFMLPYAHL